MQPTTQCNKPTDSPGASPRPEVCSVSEPFLHLVLQAEQVAAVCTKPTHGTHHSHNPTSQPGPGRWTGDSPGDRPLGARDPVRDKGQRVSRAHGGLRMLGPWHLNIHLTTVSKRPGSRHQLRRSLKREFLHEPTRVTRVAPPPGEINGAHGVSRPRVGKAFLVRFSCS